MKKLALIVVSFITFHAMAFEPHGWAINPKCPKNAPFQFFYGIEPPFDWKGKCLSCDDDQFFYATEEKCKSVCPNRIFDQRLDASYCRKPCPADKPFWDNGHDKRCKSCKERPFKISKTDCLKCPNMRWIEQIDPRPVRNQDGKIIRNSTDKSFCAPKNFIHTGTFISGQLKEGSERIVTHDSSGGDDFFVSCENPENYIFVQASPEECAQCPNTHMQDDKCYFKQEN